MSIDRAAIGDNNSISFRSRSVQACKAYSRDFYRLQLLPLFLLTGFFVACFLPFLLLVCWVFSYFPLLKGFSVYFEYLDQFFISLTNLSQLVLLTLIFLKRVLNYYLFHFPYIMEKSLRSSFFKKHLALVYWCYFLIFSLLKLILVHIIAVI